MGLFLAAGIVSLKRYPIFKLFVKDDLMTATQEDSTATANNKRKFRSPNRVLARSFRLARDKWKQKYMELRAKLKSARQLATERGTSRDRWRAECDAANQRAIQAEALAQQRLDKLEQLRSEQQELKKKRI